VGAGRAVEARAGHRGDTDLLDEMADERHVVAPAEAGDVGHHVIGAGRHRTPQPGALEHRHHAIAPRLVMRGQLVEVGRRQVEREGRRLLQRRRGADGQEVVHLADAGGERRRRHRPADAPAGHAEGLRHAVDRHRAIGHPLDRHQRHVAGAVVDDVLVDLVGDRDDVPRAAEGGDRLELVAAEDLAGGVVRRVDDDRPGLRRERRGELVGIERPAGRAQRHVPGRGARQDGVRAVVLVERLEDDHLVAGIDDPEQAGDHRLGRSAADRHLRVGVDRHAVAPRPVAGDGLAQDAGAPGHRILVHVAVDGPAGGRLDLGRRGEVGEALREVDGAVALGEAGHLADHRLGEAGGLGGRSELGHGIAVRGAPRASC
jgi:hypothetical protein